MISDLLPSESPARERHFASLAWKIPGIRSRGWNQRENNVEKIVLLGILASALTTPASAANWIPIFTDSSGNRWEVDAETIQSRDASRTAWVKLFFGPNARSKGYLISRYLFDCRNRRLTQLSAVGYKPDGDFINTVPTAELLPWTDTPPDSAFEFIQGRVCSVK